MNDEYSYEEAVEDLDVPASDADGVVGGQGNYQPGSLKITDVKGSLKIDGVFSKIPIDY